MLRNLNTNFGSFNPFHPFPSLSIMNLNFEFSQLNWSPHYNYGDLHSHRNNVQRTTKTLFFNPERIAYILRFDELDLHIKSSHHKRQLTWFHEDGIDVIIINFEEYHGQWGRGNDDYNFDYMTWPRIFSNRLWFQSTNSHTHQLNFIPQNYLAFGVIATYYDSAI